MELTGNGVTVLVVEDDVQSRRMLQLFLEKRGYSVILADDGEDAIDLLEHIKPEIILLDWKLPIKSGADVLKSLPSQSVRYSKVVVVTAEVTSKAQALEMGADGWLAKPFGFKDLFAAINEALATDAVAA